MLIIPEIFHLFYIRNIHTTSLTWEAIHGTPVVWVCILIVVGGQLLFTYAPFMQEIFDTRPLTLADGAILIGVGAAFLAIVEMEKQLRLRLNVSTVRTS